MLQSVRLPVRPPILANASLAWLAAALLAAVAAPVAAAPLNGPPAPIPVTTTAPAPVAEPLIAIPADPAERARLPAPAVIQPLLAESSAPAPASAEAAAAAARVASASAAAPATAATGGLTALVARLRSAIVPNREMECLAGAIYFESKSEPLAGQLAVGQVVANRTRSGRFPRSYCGVVFQPRQFSFVRGGAMPRIARSSLQWRTAVAIAHIVDQALHVSQVSKALFFHARYVSPRWRLQRLATIGNHIFYR